MGKEIVDLQVPAPKGVEKVTTPEEKKKTVAERITAVEEDAMVLEATKKAHGGGEGGGGPVESLATQIVTKSMDTQTKLIETMGTNTKELEKKVDAANESAATMQFQLLQQQMGQLQQAQKKTDDSAKEALGAGAPKSAFEHYNSVKGELEKLVSAVKAAEPAPQPQQGMSDSTQIRLKELEMDQQRVLAQITADNTRAQNAFNLKLAEFQDNKEIRRMEYQDKKGFRTEGMQGVTDLVAALGAGLEKNGRPVNQGDTGTSEKVAGSEEAEMGAYISSFKCAVCGEDVPVQAGKGTAICPNPECNAGFTIKDKE